MYRCPHCGQDLQVSVTKPAGASNHHDGGSRPIPTKKEPMTLDRALAIEIKFGRHRGRTLAYLADAHPDYLAWLVKNVNNAFIKQAAQVVAATMDKDSDPDPEVHVEDPIPY